MEEYINPPGLRSIRPGKLRGLSDSQIERRLEQLFGCTVDYDDGVAYIYCVDAYDSPKLLQKHATKRLSNVGRVSYGCRNGHAYVKLELNDIARRVIGGVQTSSFDKHKV